MTSGAAADDSVRSVIAPAPAMDRAPGDLDAELAHSDFPFRGIVIESTRGSRVNLR